MATTMTGKVTRIVRDKGFGFIEASGREYFFHRTGVESARMEDISEGVSVKFEPTEGPKGLRAEHVSIIS